MSGRGSVHEAEYAFGGVGGGVAALAEEFLEVEVVDPELLPAAGVVEQFVEFAVEVFGGKVVLDQFFYNEFVHDEVDEGDVFDFDEAFGDLVGDGAAFVTDDFGNAEEGRFQCSCAGGDAGCLCLQEQGVGLVGDRGNVGVGGEEVFIK